MSGQHLGEDVINLTMPTVEPCGQLTNKLYHSPSTRILHPTSLPDAKRLFFGDLSASAQPRVPSIWWTNFRHWASRSISMTPANTKTAGSETVRYELVTRRAPLRCTADRRLRYFPKIGTQDRVLGHPGCKLFTSRPILRFINNEAVPQIISDTGRSK